MQYDDRVLGTPEDGVCDGSPGGLHIWEADRCCQCGVERDALHPLPAPGTFERIVVDALEQVAIRAEVEHDAVAYRFLTWLDECEAGRGVEPPEPS
jgi:hypothetical protein